MYTKLKTQILRSKQNISTIYIDQFNPAKICKQLIHAQKKHYKINYETNWEKLVSDYYILIYEIGFQFL